MHVCTLGYESVFLAGCGRGLVREGTDGPAWQTATQVESGYEPSGIKTFSSNAFIVTKIQ